jgi:Dolichyl-phosphate-mannose-protein mannosyltransferase
VTKDGLLRRRRWFVGLLAVGVVLRVWITLTWKPAFVGYYDAAAYARAARDGVFTDLFRPAGYPVFLRIVHAVSDRVLAVTALQHLLGIATALILYVAVRQVTSARWAALIAPAVILLDGFEVLIEHAVLSDSLFILLVAAALLTTVQAPRHGLAYALLPGLLIAAASTVRTIGLFLVPIFLLALVWPRPREGLRRAVLAGVAVAVILGGYLHLQKHAVGATGFSRASGWSSYSRVGQFADCSKFTPPAGTEKLCETRPPSERPSTDFYFWSAGSPARKAFGPPNTNDALVGEFAHAVIRAQPGEYVKAVGQDFARYVWPEHYRRRRSGETQAHYLAQANLQRDAGFVRFEMSGYYPSIPETHRVAVPVTSAYMSVTWVRGPLMALLLGLALAAPLLARGAARRAALLASATGYVLLIVPVATQVYDARYALSALGPLSVAAALALDGWASRRARPAAPSDGAESLLAAV